MKTEKISLLNGWIPVISALLLLVFWMSYAFFLPMKETYLNWVLDRDWTWVNILGFCGSLLGVFAIASIHQYLNTKKWLAFLSACSAIIGIVMLTSLLFFEAFILKGLAKYSPEIVKLNEGFYGERSFINANISGGIFFSVGIVGLGISMLLQKTFKKWKVVLLCIGAPLFGMVIMPGNLRLMGVLLYVVSLIGMGFEMIKDQKYR